MKKYLPYILTAAAALLIGAGGLWLVQKWEMPRPPKPPVPPIVLPEKVTGHVGRIVTLEAETSGGVVKWYIISGPTTDDFDMLVHSDHAIHFVTPVKGEYRVEALVVVGKEAFKAETRLLIDSTVPPVPPDPPPPVPPTPPIQADGLTAMIIRDDSAIGSLPQAQIDIINSTAIPAYIKSVATQPKGGYRQYEVSQVDEQFTDDPVFWREAFKKAKSSTGFKAPWLLISNGTSGFSGPLPTTETEVIGLLKKYTPAKKVGIVIFPERVLPEFAREELVAWQAH